MTNVIRILMMVMAVIAVIGIVFFGLPSPSHQSNLKIRARPAPYAFELDPNGQPVWPR